MYVHTCKEWKSLFCLVLKVDTIFTIWSEKLWLTKTTCILQLGRLKMKPTWVALLKLFNECSKNLAGSNLVFFLLKIVNRPICTCNCHHPMLACVLVHFPPVIITFAQVGYIIYILCIVVALPLLVSIPSVSLSPPFSLFHSACSFSSWGRDHPVGSQSFWSAFFSTLKTTWGVCLGCWGRWDPGSRRCQVSRDLLGGNVRRVIKA